MNKKQLKDAHLLGYLVTMSRDEQQVRGAWLREVVKRGCPYVEVIAAGGTTTLLWSAKFLGDDVADQIRTLIDDLKDRSPHIRIVQTNALQGRVQLLRLAEAKALARKIAALRTTEALKGTR